MVDPTVQLEFLHNGSLIAQRRNDEVPIPELNARLARMGRSCGSQIVVVHNRAVALDRHLTPEVVKVVALCGCVLEEDLCLVHDRWYEYRWILRLPLIIRDD